MRKQEIKSEPISEDIYLFNNSSYPTIKNRLNKIGSQLSFVEIEQGSDADSPPQTRKEVLDRLSKGELTVTQALEWLKGK